MDPSLLNAKAALADAMVRATASRDALVDRHEKEYREKHVLAETELAQASFSNRNMLIARIADLESRLAHTSTNNSVRLIVNLAIKKRVINEKYADF